MQNLHTSPRAASHRTARAVQRTPWSTLSALLLLSNAAAQEGPRVPADLPWSDPDAKHEHWVAPLKDGVAPTDMSHMTPAERASELDAVRALSRGRSAASPDSGGGDKPALDPSSTKSGVDPAQFHQLDRSADGTLWAFGGTYKARFGADGASYVPFLGSAAPRNFPVTFRVREATLGGDVLNAELAVLPTFEENTAVYQRGAFEERYDTRVGSMEQLFVFHELHHGGDLVVRLDVESELTPSITADGLTWQNSLGGVTYSNAIAIDGAGRRAAAPTRLVDGVVELTVPAEFVASAVLPLTIDPVLASYVVNGTTTLDDIDPDIAYDMVNDRFMIIYERIFSASDHDVWAEMFSSFGTPFAGTGQYIDVTSLDWRQAKCANNHASTQFLVVATVVDVSPTQVWGRTREAESLTQSAQFQVSVGSTGPCRAPDVGGDPHPSPPSFYCVVWEREFNPGVDHDVHARLVTTSGTLTGTSPILIDNSGSTIDVNPTVSKSAGVQPGITQDWNIAWNRRFSTNDWDIRGAQVHWDGTITTASFSVDFSARNDLAPKPSSPLDPTGGPRSYMIVYQGLDGSDWDIYGAYLTGNVVHVRENLSHKWISGSAQNEFTPVVDTNGSHFAVAYHRNFGASATDYDVFVAGVYFSQGAFFVAEGPLGLAASTTFEGNTELCARYSGGLVSDFCGVVWVDYSPTNGGNIEGALYELRDGFGHSIGTSYCTSQPNSTFQAGRLRASGTSLVILTDVTLHAWQLPANATLFFLTSMTAANTPNPGGSSGTLCLGGSIGRYVAPGQIQNTGSTGTASLLLDLSSHPTPTGTVSVVQGNTWRYQAWYRDSLGGGGVTSNFTEGIAVQYQ